MAKECVNCGRKIGFMSGEHFDGLLCDNCYNEFGGMALINLETERDPNKYIECYKRIASEVDKKASPNADREIIKREFYKHIDLEFKLIAKYGIKEYLQKKKADEEIELRHINYARSFN